jgi:hypothetical protein
MLLAALCDLGAPVAEIERCLARLGIPELSLCLDRVEVGGVSALHARSIPTRAGAPHRRLREVLSLLARARPRPGAAALAERVFRLLAEAEAEAHGAAVDTVELHEVGQLDSILDVLGIAVAIDALGQPEVACEPLPLGMGVVETSHGRLTLPVPAVRLISARHGVPTTPVAEVGETVTPTGIAVVAAVCTEFGLRSAEAPAATGVGAGTRRFPTRRNLVRILGYRGRGGGGA